MAQLVYFYVDAGITKYGTTALVNTFDPATAAFRFYEDGTESGSSPIDDQDTNINRNVDSDSQVHLRYRVDETGGLDGASSDDYALEYSKNSGSFLAVTGSSSNVESDSGSSLSNGSVTTNRGTNGITDGSGSFIAGEQEDANGVIENRQLTADNFTEHVWGLNLIAADLSNNDTLDFRVTLNGGTPGMTNSVTPRITAQKAVSNIVGPLALMGVGV